MEKSHTILAVKIKSREIIKPSSPTPPHLKHLPLSRFDQWNPDYYLPFVLFYTQNGIGDDISQISRRLKSSLSQLLTRFYPFAGRIKDNAWVECNDEGAGYTEAQINCSVPMFLRNPDLDQLEKLHPADAKLTTIAGGGPLVTVQATFFECGGLALAICLSHKFADVATSSAFISSWAAICGGGADPSRLVSPEFNLASSVFSPKPSVQVVTMPNQTCIATRRFLFNGAKIAQLKAKAASEKVPQPSRVEAVTALLWKCAIAASTSNNGSSKPSILAQAVNLRKRLAPPLKLQENCMGNLSTVFSAQIEDGDEISLPQLVSQLRRKLEIFTQGLAEKVEGDDAISFILEIPKELRKKVNEVFHFSSSCKFPFYEADFGLGKPTWAPGIPPIRKNNSAVLFDAKDGEGIEAWVSLSEQEMEFFQRDQELIAFASLNPSVTVNAVQ